MARRLLSYLFALNLGFALACPALYTAYAEDAPAVYPFRLYLAAVSRGAPAGAPAPAASSLPSLASFAASVTDGAAVVRGVYVESLLALQVLQQPAGQAGYVSARPDTVTQFEMAAWYGVTGLLAHNYAAGRLFANLELGDGVSVVYGDGQLRQYRISAILRYQAVQPNSPTSDFIDLATGAKVSAADVFLRVYTGGEHVTFQTCIEAGGLGNWGRLFVMAEPAD